MWKQPWDACGVFISLNSWDAGPREMNNPAKASEPVGLEPIIGLGFRVLLITYRVEAE
jgi:hypothetical protein